MHTNILYLMIISLFLLNFCTTNSSDYQDFDLTDKKNMIEVSNGLAENRWENLYESMCTPLKAYLQSNKMMFMQELPKRWQISYEIFEKGLVEAYKTAPHLKDSDMVRELKGISEGCKLDFNSLLMTNHVYEIMTIGCTSILFNNPQGYPTLASNLDWFNPDFISNVTLNINFLKNGKLILQSNHIFGHYGIHRAQSPGKYSLALNEWNLPHTKDVASFFKWLLTNNSFEVLTGLRVLAFQSDSYSEFVSNIKDNFYSLSPFYISVAGIEKNQASLIIKNPENTYLEIVELKDQINNFIVQCNMDRQFYDHDVRRKSATEKILNYLKNNNFITESFVKDEVLQKSPNFVDTKTKIGKYTTKLRTANTTVFVPFKGSMQLNSWKGVEKKLRSFYKIQ